MAFVEAMAIEVSGVTVPERPIREVPFPGSTYAEAMERYGSDKPDIRFAMELVDLAPALTGPRRAGVRLPGVRRDARVRRPGEGDRGARDGRRDAPRDRRPDRDRPKRFGAQGPRPSRGRRARTACIGPIAKFRRRGRRGRDSSRPPAPTEGDLILVVADTADTTADVLGRLRAELGIRLGLADPNVLAYCWVNRFPMYKWDAESGRWDATHNPFSGVMPGGRAAAHDGLGRPRPASPGRSGRPRPGDAVRPRAERLGARRRVGPDLAQRPAGAQLPAPGLLARSRCTSGSARCSRRSSTGRRRTAASPSGSTAGRRCSRDQTNIREVMAFPKTPSGGDLMLEAPSAPEAEQYAELGLRFVGVPGRD